MTPEVYNPAVVEDLRRAFQAGKTLQWSFNYHRQPKWTDFKPGSPNGPREPLCSMCDDDNLEDAGSPSPYPIVWRVKPNLKRFVVTMSVTCQSDSSTEQVKEGLQAFLRANVSGTTVTTERKDVLRFGEFEVKEGDWQRAHAYPTCSVPGP